ncbi:MAG: NAD(P)-dependent alcohol dehydrogenase [Elusimicrobia bacterium]|nr:NAD(P)-dependent alcohol dehydrogenase [Elusimicrobiota bacterium]
MIAVKAYAAKTAGAPLEPFSVARREPGERDVLIEIAYCGICHSDIHQARQEWGPASFPMVPGHEIAGRVARVGSKVRRFKPDDWVGVGCFVDSCRTCASCRSGHQQFCRTGVTYTYNSLEQDRRTPTFGGYSTAIVVDEDYVLKLPPRLPPERLAPLFCAGVTTYAPLKRWGARRGRRLGVVGLGGLGHMAVKIGAALGAEVSVVSRSRAKAADAKRLGAADFFAAGEGASAKALRGHFDLLIDTVSAVHDVGAELSWLKPEGTLILVGLPPRPLQVEPFPLVGFQRVLAGSNIGGVAETQEMLDFCARNKISADVEVIPVERVNEAYERAIRGDVRFRFVIDASSLR